MLEFHNHQNLGYEALHEHLRLQLDTEAVWLTIPERVLQTLGAEREDAVAGIVHALGACARMRTMAERSDLCGTSFHATDAKTGRTVTAVVLYDSHPGGLGYAATAYEQLEAVIADARALVSGCRCRDGCPACVGSYSRDRQLIGWALQSIAGEVPIPEGRRASRPLTETPAPSPAKVPARIPWEDVAAQWQDVVAHLRAHRVDGAEVLGQLSRVAIRGTRLVVEVSSVGLSEWLRQDPVQRRIWESLTGIIEAPADGRLSIEVVAAAREQALSTVTKLTRRHDDLVAGTPRTESEANRELASGYLLPDSVAKPDPSTSAD
jgi:DEAD/DEAH box helicase domain-containing protein